jgi:S-adenosylmethionine hydrolase
VLSLDSFGNVALDAPPAAFAAAAVLDVDAGGAQSTAALGRTFSDVGPGELVAYEDSRGRLALAVNGGSAAQRLRIAVDDELVLRAR